MNDLINRIPESIKHLESSRMHLEPSRAGFCANQWKHCSISSRPVGGALMLPQKYTQRQKRKRNVQRRRWWTIGMERRRRVDGRKDARPFLGPFMLVNDPKIV